MSTPSLEKMYLVERPADALHGATLHLALDIAGVDGGAGILHGRVADDRGLPGLLVDLHIGTVHGEHDRRRRH